MVPICTDKNGQRRIPVPVLTNLNGKSLDKYRAKNDNTDRFFNKGYGKMYLMR